MAINKKISDTRTKTKKSDKKQGETAKTGQASDTRTKPMAADQSRGIGSSFAYAVKKIMEDAGNMKGSKSGFLGVESEVLDPKEFAQSLIKKQD